MAIAILGGIFLLVLIVVPRLWILTVLHRHSQPREDFPGTGGEFARHLLDEMKLDNVKVEETDTGDHYHPISKAVRLKAEHLHGRSLTAVVIAAHEVGHAMQDATDYPPLQRRTKLAHLASYIQQAGAVVLVASPIFAAVIHRPAGLALGAIAFLLVNVSAVIMHLMTLPVEFDASFNRALPVLKAGRYISDRDLKAAKHILTAAAFTYVAAALMSIISIGRLLRR